MHSLATELLGASRAAILATLLVRPEREVHVRELARMTGISAGTLHRELRVLSDLGLLARREIGRQVFYSANQKSAVFAELAGLLRKTAGLADLLRTALAPLSDRILVAFIYGSMAAGTAAAHSDVDVMVVGSATFSEVVKALHGAQDKVGREINPTVMSPAEFKRKRAGADGFVVSVARAPKIWLIGDADDFAKLGQSRAAKAA
jgi:predicted nucleotidyltransferase